MGRLCRSVVFISFNSYNNFLIWLTKKGRVFFVVGRSYYKRKGIFYKSFVIYLVF
jgi:hypothetical protein